MQPCLKSSIRILYVDSDPEDFMIFCHEMSGAGFHDVTSLMQARPKELLDYLRKNNTRLPDAMLIDVGYPPDGGVEILRSVRRHPQFQKIPVVLISGSRVYLDSVRYGNPGIKADGFIVKPVTAGELAHVLGIFPHCMVGG